MFNRLLIFCLGLTLAFPAVAEDQSRPVAKARKSGVVKKTETYLEKKSISDHAQQQQISQPAEAFNDSVKKESSSSSRCSDVWLTLDCYPSTISIRGAGMDLTRVADSSERGKVHFWGLAYEHVFERPWRPSKGDSSRERSMLSIRGGYLKGTVDVIPVDLTYYLSPFFFTFGFNLGAWIIPSGPKLNGKPTSIPTWSANSMVNPVFGGTLDFRVKYFDLRANPMGLYSNKRLTVWVDVSVGMAF